MKHLFYTFLSGLLFISNILPSNAQDYPPNPLEKEGYRLIFHDEFDGKEINTDKWIPEYLPSWPKDRSVCTPTYERKKDNNIMFFFNCFFLISNTIKKSV